MPEVGCRLGILFCRRQARKVMEVSKKLQAACERLQQENDHLKQARQQHGRAVMPVTHQEDILQAGRHQPNHVVSSLSRMGIESLRALGHASDWRLRFHALQIGPDRIFPFKRQSHSIYLTASHKKQFDCMITDFLWQASLSRYFSWSPQALAALVQEESSTSSLRLRYRMAAGHDNAAEAALSGSKN